MAITQATAQSLYIAYFGRPGDPSGRTFWTSSASATGEDVANGFAKEAEYTTATAGQSVAQIVNGFYQNLFGRNAEVAGLNYWVGEIAAGRTTTQQAGLTIASEALNAVPANSDTVALQSKITAAQQFTNQVETSTASILAYTGTAAIATGVSYLNGVTTTATIPTAAATTATVAALATTGVGSSNTLELSAFQDLATVSGYNQLTGAGGTILSTSSFSFTASNETVNATAFTFTGAVTGPDALVDATTTDEDVLNITGVTNVTALGDDVAGTAATVTNIENINVALTGAATGSFNATANLNYNGSDTLTFTGTMANGATLTSSNATAGNGGFTTVNASAVTGNGIALALTGDGSGETITGSASNSNTIDGAGGADTLVGGAAADIIDGGAGSDTLTGGTGVDVFRYDALTDGADTITDFTAGGAGDAISVNIGTAAATTFVAKAGGVNAGLANGTLCVITGTLAADIINVSGNDAADVAAIAAAVGTVATNGSEGAVIFNADTDGNGTADAVQVWSWDEALTTGTAVTAVNQLATLSNVATGDLAGVFAAANAVFV